MHNVVQPMSTYLATEVMPPRASHQTTGSVTESPYLK